MIGDPVISGMVAAAIAIVFLVGAWQKLRDVDAFAAAVEDYAILPEALVRPFARALPLAEALAAVALIVERTRVTGVWLAFAVLAVVTFGVVVNLVRGRTELGCGCAGLEDEQTLSFALVARNGALAALVGLALAEAPTRTLAWLDYLSVGAGAICLFCLYLAFNQLLANAPRLARLRMRA